MLHKPTAPKGLVVFAGRTDLHVPMSLGWAAHHFGHTRSFHPTTMNILVDGVLSIQTCHPWTCWVGASNVCLHCVAITLQWSRATIHTMCNMCIRFGTIGFSYNDMWNTKAGIMYVYSWMSAMWVIVAHPAYVSFEDTLAQSKRCFFVGNFFCQGHHKWQWIGPTTRLCEDRRS